MNNSNNITFEDQYLTLKQLSKYSSLSVRTIRDYLNDPVDPIPAYRLKRKILILRSQFDSWMQNNKIGGNVNNIVEEMVNAVI